MIFIAIILFAALPHTDNVWAQSGLIALGMLITLGWLREWLGKITENQKLIYQELSKRG